MPDQVVLELATPLVAEQSRVLVRQPGGRGHPSETMGSMAGEVLVTLLQPGGPDGAWTVAYEAVSTDGHTLTGTVAFTVGAESLGATAAAGMGGLGWMLPLLGVVLVTGFSFRGQGVAGGARGGRLMISLGTVPADPTPAKRRGQPVRRPGDESAGLRIPTTLWLVMLISAGAAAAAAAGPDAFGDGFWDSRTQAAASATAKATGVLGACGTIGALVVSVFLVDAGDRTGRATRLRVTRAAAPWAALWCLGTVVSAAVLFARADGGPADAFAWSMRTLVVTAWATAVIAVLVRGRPSPSTGGAALGLAVAAVMGSVAGGHAWHTEDRLVMVSSLVVHVLAVAARLGCLLVLAVHLPRASRVDAAMLQRFSSLALVCFVLVAASGTANVVSRLGPTELFGSGTYGALLVVVKVALFGLVGFLGLAHRRRTLPTLADGDSRPFWTLVAGELVVLAAVAGLGAALAGASPADGGAGDDEHAAVRI